MEDSWYMFLRGEGRRVAASRGGTKTRAKREEERVVWRARAPAAPIYAPVTEPSGAIKLAL